MAAGFITASCPSFTEHEANIDAIRNQISELKKSNAKYTADIKTKTASSHMGSEKMFWARNKIADLEDRGKYIRIASISNPGAIAQFCPNLKGPLPHTFYQEQVAKIRQKTRAQLMSEASRELGLDDTGSKPKRGPRVREVPSNFSPGSNTENSSQKMSDPVLLGLRNLTHWNSHRKVGTQPKLLPQGSQTHAFKEHTTSWLARDGNANPAQNRDYVSSLTRTASATF
ncbi:unnamed protein product [Polarella glacialis]|uniref:Uncharacterized protein n=1 Tax=Polarella glacialis TaxID=89957 RepID=A0A813LLW4_POLGL|nr:unnamed protein product [Polarella glacialis]CAE8733090.1 unnamed protein product [Polarella glacialis]